MAKKKLEKVSEVLFYTYANLAMAHTAVERGHTKYGTFNYIIRAKLFKGLKEGSMNIRSIFDDEKIKIQTGSFCNYCGSSEKLALDHILSKHSGGGDLAENLILACRACNSSKGKKDLLEWMLDRQKFLPLMVIRRYLKLTYSYCLINDLLDKNLNELEGNNLPFRIDLLPLTFPLPTELKLNIL